MLGLERVARNDFAAVPGPERLPRADVHRVFDEGDVAVAPNEPKTIYYVLTLNRRFPASFAVLYAPNGDYFRYRNEAVSDAFKSREKTWMEQLRVQAGLPADWSPTLAHSTAIRRSLS